VYTISVLYIYLFFFHYISGPLLWPRDTLYPQKLAPTSPTSGGRSVGIFRLRTKATEFSFNLLLRENYWCDWNLSVIFFLICIVGGGIRTGSTRHIGHSLACCTCPGWLRMDNLVAWMAGETEVLGENLPRRHLVHQKSHLTRPGIEPGPPRWEASD
jgi:hypothetical protein